MPLSTEFMQLADFWLPSRAAHGRETLSFLHPRYGVWRGSAIRSQAGHCGPFGRNLHRGGWVPLNAVAVTHFRFSVARSSPASSRGHRPHFLLDGAWRQGDAHPQIRLRDKSTQTRLGMPNRLSNQRSDGPAFPHRIAPFCVPCTANVRIFPRPVLKTETLQRAETIQAQTTARSCARRLQAGYLP